MQNKFDEIAKLAANGNEDAYVFIKLWHSYAHMFDDLIDENFSIENLIAASNEKTKLLTCKFFREYGASLLPLIYLSAEAYQASETLEKDSFLGLYLSHEGNNIIRAVALITGDFKLLVKVSTEIRKLTYEEHPLEDNINLKNK